MGLYSQSDHTIHLPLEVLLNSAGEAMETLRHELAHQMMNEMLGMMPWWVAEGTAEYVRSIRWEGSAYDCASINSTAAMKRLAAEGEMDEQAFKAMLVDGINGFQEEQVGMILATAFEKAWTEHLRIREDRTGQKLADAQFGRSGQVVWESSTEDGWVVREESIRSGNVVRVPSLET